MMEDNVFAAFSFSKPPTKTPPLRQPSKLRSGVLSKAFHPKEKLKNQQWKKVKLEDSQLCSSTSPNSIQPTLCDDDWKMKQTIVEAKFSPPKAENVEILDEGAIQASCFSNSEHFEESTIQLSRSKVEPGEDVEGSRNHLPKAEYAEALEEREMPELFPPKIELAEAFEEGTVPFFLKAEPAETFEEGALYSGYEEKVLVEGNAESPSPETKIRLGNVVSGRGGDGFSRSSEEIEDCGGLSLSRVADSNELESTSVVIQKRPRKKGSNAGPGAWTPPSNWEESLQSIREMRTVRDAPVDLLGPEQLVDTTADLETQKFHVLVSAMISSQTRDAVTAAAMKRLHAMPGGLNVHQIAGSNASIETLEELLKPVGFYRQKAKYLKGIAEMLLMPPHNGSVPRKLDELMALPGVGPKVGLLVLWVGFGKGEEGLIVDTNVRRVCCRLGWAPEGSTPEKVREALESWLPTSLWADVSFLFVGFGQQVCKPIGPKCQECHLNNLCPSAFKCAKKVTRKKGQSRASSK